MQSLLNLLKKYDVPGPRYTSYPTVPAWTHAVGASQYEESLQRLHHDESLSLYFHLPFCESLCHFCGCMQVITKDHSRSAPYIDTISAEVRRVAALIPEPRAIVSQLHLGGGTPNFIQPDELRALIKTVRDVFSIAPDAELAVEMHPRTSTRAFCEALAELGFNRISLGVQDFDPHVQSLINRDQTYEMTRDMLVMLSQLGFSSINMDLVYGLPGQTIATFEKTLDRVLELSPKRLAVYSYAHVPWIRPVQRTFKDSDLPTPEQKLELFMRAYEAFTRAGYEPIGMDHFAREDDELAQALKTGGIHRNFMGYSTRADAHQLGFGVSAISYVNGHYFQNEKKLDAYTQAIRAERLATFRGILSTSEDALRRDLMTELMCALKIDIPRLESKYGIVFADHFKKEIPKLKGFIDDKLLVVSPTEIRVMGRGHLFLRNIAMVFDAYLEKIKEAATTPTFSRTV